MTWRNVKTTKSTTKSEFERLTYKIIELSRLISNTRNSFFSSESESSDSQKVGRDFEMVEAEEDEE